MINISKDCKDFILKLLERNKDERIGSKYDEPKPKQEIRKHPWFKGCDWENLKKQKGEMTGHVDTYVKSI